MIDLPIQFDQPIWLVGLVGLVPVVWLGRRSMSGLGRWRQRIAIGLRALVLAILIMLLAGPVYARKFKRLSVVTIIDRSQSVPEGLKASALKYVEQAAATRPKEDRLGVVNAGEVALIEALPDAGPVHVRRDAPLRGDRTDLEGAVRMALAVLPPDTARRILLISDGNENAGDLREVAKIAKANRIPLDVLALNFTHEREVMLERLIVPHNARMGQTIAVKCVLRSTRPARGKLVLEDNGKIIDLDPDSEELALPLALKSGLNVTTVHLPIRSGGIHRFRASFAVDNEEDDTLTANNSGAGVTFVAGKGRVLVVDTDGRSSNEIMRSLKQAGIDAEYRPAYQFPTGLLEFMEFDSIVLVNAANSSFSLDQQEMMTRYVHDIGGGLVMVGGPDSFGAGGWIGSPVEKALPVDLDPPQRQQMPCGALVLIMHSCEMPRGNYWGEQVAIAAVKSLSRLDLVGVLEYDWAQGKGTTWVYPLAPAGDKTKVISAIKKMRMGDMPDFGSGMQMAYNDLVKCDAGQKHIIIISDGDPSPPTLALLNKLKAAKITVTGVAVFPHSPADVNSLRAIAQATGGRFYNVKDPNRLPRIFVKEAQVVRRPLILEKPFRPRIIDPLSELTKGIELQPPILDGYVLTAEKKELVETIMVSPQKDPILAGRYYGLGKTVAFTSDASSRWASNWLNWPRFEQFWEQVVRWSMRSGESPNLQVLTELEGERATVYVEAGGQDTEFANFLDISGVVIDPDLKTTAVKLEQVGPGRYRAGFNVSRHGNYVVNLQFKDGNKTGLVSGALSVPFAPEFRDLKDNSALLSEAAKLTGGRVLSGIPERDKLFDHSSLVFPSARKPLWKPLALLWLVLFLSEVAVRRVAVDFRAEWRRIRQAIGALAGRKETAEAVAALRDHQLQVRRRLKRAPDVRRASRRYEPTADALSKQTGPPTVAEKEPPTEPVQTKEEKVRKIEPAAASYLDRLKEAKRKAQRDMEDDTTRSE